MDNEKDEKFLNDIGSNDDESAVEAENSSSNDESTEENKAENFEETPEEASSTETEETPEEALPTETEEKAEDTSAAEADVDKTEITETEDKENTSEKKSFVGRWIEKEKEKEKNKREREKLSEERMKRVREERRAAMYADGKEPNALQKFLMSEGKFINYENKAMVTFAAVIILGILVFIAVFRGGYFSKEKFGLGGDKSRAIVYSVGNELYCYDLKKEPVLISDTLSAGGSVSYSYVGNGITVANDGTSVYFTDEVGADGTFRLNYYEASSSKEPEVIGTSVSDYEVSNMGDGAVYIVANETGNSGTLYGYDKKNNKSSEIANDIAVNSREYAISSDGKKVIYIKEENSSTTLYVANIDGTGETKIDTDIAQYLVQTEGNSVYYIKAVGTDNGTSMYSVYEYDLSNGNSKLIDEDVIAVTLSQNENAVIYYKNSGKKVKASSVLNDDGDNSEETEALRKELENYEFNDITCALYRYENGKSELVNDEIFTAMPTDADGKYIAYTVPSGLGKIKVNLSEISSPDDLVASYYEQAAAADVDTYIYKTNGFNDYVVFDGSYIYSYQNSGNNAQVACLKDYDRTNQKGQLVLSTYDENGIKSYAELEDDVESFEFMGDGSRIVYLRGVDDNGFGTLTYIESNVPDEVSTSAYYYEVTKDFNRSLFYLDNYDSSTYGGTFHYYQQGKDIVVDDGVYMFAYRNNNNALYMKNYDSLTATGDLYYLNGKTSKLVAEGVSSVFDFYDAGR